MSLGFEFAPIDVKLPDHPRVREIERKLRRAALGLYVAGHCYARLQRTGGSLPRTFAEDDDPRLAAELVRVGLWIARDDGGWDIFNFGKKTTSSTDRVRRYRQRVKRDDSVSCNADETLGNAFHETHTSVSVSSSVSSDPSREDPDPASQVRIVGAGEQASGPPEWFSREAVDIVRMNAGIPVDDVGARWVEYSAARARKGWAMNATDAAGWLTTVLRGERTRARASPRSEPPRQPLGDPSAFPWLASGGGEL